jgi:hypothetical protein
MSPLPFASWWTATAVLFFAFNVDEFPKKLAFPAKF